MSGLFFMLRIQKIKQINRFSFRINIISNNKQDYPSK